MTGKEIKELRERLNLSQEAFALKIGARASQISRWECGKVKMSKLYYEQLKKVFGDGLQIN